MASGSETPTADGALPPWPGSRIRYVFLDVGETLLRVTQPGRAYQAILARHGYDVPAELLDATIREQFKALDSVLPRQRNPDHTISAELAQQRRERLIEGVLDYHAVRAADRAAIAAAFPTPRQSPRSPSCRRYWSHSSAALGRRSAVAPEASRPGPLFPGGRRLAPLDRAVPLVERRTVPVPVGSEPLPLAEGRAPAGPA